MTLLDLFRHLSYGELSNLALANDGNGTIREAEQPKIALYANEALLRLYSKFILREKDVLIEMVEHITNYHLLVRFSQQGYDPEGEAFPYILDMNKEPFEEDVIKILAVFDSFGDQLPLNDNERCNSVFTPQANVLQVPRPCAGQSLGVLYQARHQVLSADDLEGEIFLPDILQGALTAYIAYKVFSHMNTQESTAKAQEHYANYESICVDAKENDLVSTSISTTNARFNKYGWV